jgi:tRNA (guanine37-N1)-methyltransferase
VKFEVITIFPEFFESPLKVSLVGKAIANGLLEISVHDLRNWAPGPHRKVDDAPFGGGAGMVMAPGPIVDAVEAVRQPGGRVVQMSASGGPLTQQLASELAGERQLVLICGRYEGMDERIRQILRSDEISIGEYVLSGGEAAALVLIEAVARLVSGVLGNEASLQEESFTSGLLEYPQYTRPADFRGHKVPDVLLSGNHKLIADWRRRESLRKTSLNRPHLLAAMELSEADRTSLEDASS